MSSHVCGLPHPQMNPQELPGRFRSRSGIHFIALFPHLIKQNPVPGKHATNPRLSRTYFAPSPFFPSASNNALAPRAMARRSAAKPGLTLRSFNVGGSWLTWGQHRPEANTTAAARVGAGPIRATRNGGDERPVAASAHAAVARSRPCWISRSRLTIGRSIPIPAPLKDIPCHIV